MPRMHAIKLPAALARLLTPTIYSIPGTTEYCCHYQTRACGLRSLATPPRESAQGYLARNARKNLTGLTKIRNTIISPVNAAVRS